MKALLENSRLQFRALFGARHRKIIAYSIVSAAAALLMGAHSFAASLTERYVDLESPTILDRNGVLLMLQPNEKEQYGRYVHDFPVRVKQLIVAKEDRFFYMHPGVNPLSSLRALQRYALGNGRGGASTITQQLVKNLLGNEQNRSISNKLVELFGALSIEMFNSKDHILTMYANSVYMGNQVRGLSPASALYFGKDISELDDTKILMLLATLSSPSTQNPWRDENGRVSRNLALRLGIPFDPKLAIVKGVREYTPVQNFELASLHESCSRACTSTIDSDLTNRLREMLSRRVNQAWNQGVRSGAIVVVKLPENEIIAMVGTPDAHGTAAGQQINMAIQPRPIGSTIKPFIYLKGFEMGLRPYTLVNDREYKFPIGSGFPLYPKNYDGTYRGWITLHSALSNSLNVPTVKTLQYVTLPAFYDFLQNTLGFAPTKDLDEYQYGIALGALDMDPLTLAQFLTIFPKNGILAPLKLFLDGTSTPYIRTPMSGVRDETKVAEPAYTSLVTKVLNDRLAGVQQFGLVSSLNLSQPNYAVKTGTSQNYHDSWTVGYTPDFLVVVWFGNPDNTPLKHVTGVSGAGAIWHDTMEMLMNSDYNRKTPFDFSAVRDISVGGVLDFGLVGDAVADHRNLLPDHDLIQSPQDGDTFMLQDRVSVPLISESIVSWYISGSLVGNGTRATFRPQTSGDYTIRAVDEDGAKQDIRVHVIDRR